MSDQDSPKSPAMSSNTGDDAAKDVPQEMKKMADKWTSGDEVAPQPAAKKAAKAGPGDKDWERDVVNRLAFAAVNEQRRARRWSVFFKSLFFVYLFVLFFYVPVDWGDTSISSGKHTALVELDGVIAANSPANADMLVAALRNAYKDKNTAGIILRINSPGGSPVQSGYVYDEIMRLKKLHPDIKLYAVVTDICASGGYYIASAADEIYADKASIVGSIGVLMDGFGFEGAMKKLGVERRLLTAGEHKGILDPFSPLKPDELAHIQGLLDGIHQQFIDAVKAGRGDRLSDDPRLFSGLFWNGEEGVKLGLVDALGSSSYVAREIIGEEKIVDYTTRPNYFDRFADRIGAATANVLSDNLGLKTTRLR